jgi:hypothetical protein
MIPCDVCGGGLESGTANVPPRSFKVTIECIDGKPETLLLCFDCRSRLLEFFEARLGRS